MLMKINLIWIADLLCSRQISLLLMHIQMNNSFAIFRPVHRDGILALNKNGVLDPYEDARQPIDVRVENLLSQMTLEEKASQLLYNSKAIERLEIPEYNWWNE